MHPIITHEISRLQVEDLVSHARVARLARRTASGGAASSRGRRAGRLRARALRTTTTSA